ncbi:MAG: cell wall hydrolase [Neomegalonema sp.]|nr:cell wall hydrolase [Neomegalonema sp.]
MPQTSPLSELRAHPATLEDLLTAARTIYGEARGEPHKGQSAVAWVLKNRARLARAHLAARARVHPLYGDGTLTGAARAPWQFSCWNQDDPNRARLLAADFTDPRFCTAFAIAAQVWANLTPDPSLGATHYHHRAIAPAWSKGQRPCAAIGAHLFFNSIQ